MTTQSTSTLRRGGFSRRNLCIALVPFLAFGSIVALFAGDWILDTYVSLI
jgi:prepilin signal peptidase PulO-like enzyme (type II secretory pathway)